MRHGLRPHHIALISLAMLAIPALDADVTLRYKTEVSFNPALPPQMAQAMPGMEAVLPKESSVQLRNGKGFSSSGANVSMCDFSKQEMTLLDNEGKRYATLPFAQFGDAFAGAMPEMPSQPAGMMASMKSHFESKATGRTETIQGIEGEEHEFVMTVDAPALPNMPSGGPMMRMVMRFWRARPGEVMRVPAVREVAGYNLFAAATMNPVSSMEKVFRQMPGFANNFAAVYKEMPIRGHTADFADADRSVHAGDERLAEADPGQRRHERGLESRRTFPRDTPGTRRAFHRGDTGYRLSDPRRLQAGPRGGNPPRHDRQGAGRVQEAVSARIQATPKPAEVVFLRGSALSLRAYPFCRSHSRKASRYRMMPLREYRR